MNEAELKAQRDAARIVSITNPFDFEYTHAWGGVPYTLPVGKTLLFPFPLGDHLATHLARQALIRKAPLRDEKEIDGKGKDRPLWSEESIIELKKSIMHEEYTEETKPVLNESEILRAKIEELNRNFADLSERVGSAPQAPEATNTAFKDKAEVIAELTKKGISFDARKKKAELEKLLDT